MMKFEAKNLNAIRDLLYEQNIKKETVFGDEPTPLTTEQKICRSM